MSVDNPPCYKCRGNTLFRMQIDALGSEAGRRVFECKTCGEMTWTPLVSTARPSTTHPAENQPFQQQQQVQPDTSVKPDGEEHQDDKVPE